MKYSCVIFDLDGTLADTLGGIALSMNRALEREGLAPCSKEDYRGMVGRGMENLARAVLAKSSKEKTLSGAEFEALAQTLAGSATRFYAEDPLADSAPYAGISELLPELLRRKMKLAVLSNKPDPLARLVVRGLFPGGPFALVRGEIPGVPRKPSPEAVWEIFVELGKTPRDAILAGDSEVDMETALAAGCFPLGVSWGFRPREVIAASGAAQIIDRPEELLTLLD
jgi:phosphoglycolate phosphatase